MISDLRLSENWARTQAGVVLFTNAGSRAPPLVETMIWSTWGKACESTFSTSHGGDFSVERHQPALHTQLSSPIRRQLQGTP